MLSWSPRLCRTHIRAQQDSRKKSSEAVTSCFGMGECRDCSIKWLDTVEGSRCWVLLDLHAEISWIKHPPCHHNRCHLSLVVVLASRPQPSIPCHIPLVSHRISSSLVRRSIALGWYRRLDWSHGERCRCTCRIWAANSLCVHWNGSSCWHLVK